MHRNMSSGSRGGGSGRGDRAREDRAPSAAVDVAAIRFGDNVSRTLYSDIAEEAAKCVGEAARAARGAKNKPSQLRRFYDELVMLHDKVGSNKERFEQQEPFVQMMKAKVAYAKGRDKVDENFEKLLRHVVDQVKDVGTLRQTKLFMEAFMAFYKTYGPRD